VFLSGTLLNVVAVLVGTVIGVTAGARMPQRMQASLTAGLGLFTAVIGMSLALMVFDRGQAQPGDELAVLAAVLAGVVIGEILDLDGALEALGRRIQHRFVPADRPSRIAEGFVTASLVFCVGPLTILGSLQNGLSNDMGLLAVKALLDGVTSIAFAAALGWGVALAAGTVLVVQGGIAASAAVLATSLGNSTVIAISATGGVLLLGVALRLLDIKQVRVANFLPALLLAPIYARLAEIIRLLLGVSGS